MQPRSRQAQTANRIKDREANSFTRFQALNDAEVIDLDRRYLALFDAKTARKLERDMTARDRCMNALDIINRFGFLMNPYR